MGRAQTGNGSRSVAGTHGCPGLRDWCSALLGLFLTASVAAAQPHHTMPIGVEADRVTIGPIEFLPRCGAAAAMTLIVQPGETFTLPVGNSIWDCIEVAGTLRVSRADDTTLRVTTLYVLPGGVLDVGTVDAPIACGRKVELIVRDVQIDRTRDPYSWGNGFVNFGHQTRVGCAKTPFTEAIGSLLQGAQSITLIAPPVGWNVGDELLIPDTDQPVVTGNGLTLTAVPSRREAPVHIAAMAGALVTLDKPLDFDHLNEVDPQGVVVLRPRVANLTRNVVIRSENSAAPLVGTRGHTANIGHDATSDVRYNEFVQLGRTLNVPLDDTNVASGHVGTNQRGKYADHDHHLGSCPTCVTKGNSYRGHSLTTKWGKAVHATHDTLIEDNVVVDFPGAGMVTEDGYEVRNVFRHNFWAYSFGIPGDHVGTPSDAHIAMGCPGCDGAGAWLHGVRNVIDSNEAWNNFRGINLFNQSGTAGIYPSAPGIVPDVPFVPTDNHLFFPISFNGNVTAANVNPGVEIWATLEFPELNLISAYNAVQEAGVLSDGIDHFLINPKFICKQGTGAVGVIANQAYSHNFTATGGGQIAGCAVGIHGGGGSNGLFVDGPETLVMQNEIDIDLVPHKMTLRNVQFLPLGNAPHNYIQFSNVGRFSGTVWQADDPLPDVGDSDWRNQAGSQWIIKNWQGTGQDYRLLHVQQLGSNPAWYSGPTAHAWNCPVIGLTMQQCWDQYGIAWGGDVLRDAEKVVLDGVINGFGRAGLGVSLSQPRAVATFPTLRQPAIARGEPNNPLVTFAAMATGDQTTVADAYFTQVDDGPIINLRDFITFTGSDRSFNAFVGAPGPHQVRVWLTQKDNPTVPIAGSEYVGHFCTGPDCQTTVPATKGQTVPYAANAIVSAQLVVGAQTTAPSATVLEGRVIGTTPAAFSSVAQQTVVGLVVSSGPGTTDPPPPPPPQTCQDPAATNIGQPLPCTFPPPPPPPTCQDPAATNVGGALPCVFPPPPPPPPPPAAVPVKFRLCVVDSAGGSKCVEFPIQ